MNRESVLTTEDCAAEASRAVASGPVGLEPLRARAGRMGPSEASGPSGTEPRSEGAYLTNEEALRLLAGRDSGIRPLLDRHGYRFVKRVFDVCASGAAIALLAIPGAVLCAVICAKSPGASPIYSQWRIGRVNRDGSFRAFKMLKFRSMVPHADEMLKDLQEANEASGPMFKIRDDPRVIPGVGGFIRRHSIDELPQLLNVFLGQMSLIGPRPGLPREVALYDERAMERLAVKPGCGGAWQAGGRSDVGFEDMVELDLKYVEGRSVSRDLGLIFGTVRAMFDVRGGGLLDALLRRRSVHALRPALGGDAA